MHYKLAMTPDQPWRSRMIVVQILLFQLTSADERFQKRLGESADSMGLVLAEIGCLACWNEANYLRACRIIRRGFEHAAKVTQGRASDPDFPVRLSGDAA